ncbi:FkbM family methyltransferase [Nodosilinea sp. LEGE 07298]|jgi:FkbM family methyltransferase|uniref:FkbM family methyltransferase n=1 Tax=Nodosilinea sp. LEGE 07298 TaxID=2777970 RepID=UPI0018824A43|nr:FkbM family methyltransferase [Nodosilinea sp. LEGE 07298]MBE9109122.1 FkbM family methyltransferase [Nodosilinea sp. LEGE 07298]
MTKNALAKYTRRISKTVKVAFQKTFVYHFQVYNHHTLSFSQEGEDRILVRLFGRQENGFYIDVGAHHPQRFSNTYLFYLKGWRGINIDAMPGSMDLFKAIRPEDINIEAAISSSSECITYFMFDEPALNGFSKEVSLKRNFSSRNNIVGEKLIKTKKLSEILDEYLPTGQTIDFLSIDVEGLDYQVLLSNDWSKYRPRIILIEELSVNLDSMISSSRIKSLLEGYGYKLFAKTFNTTFYRLISI